MTRTSWLRQFAVARREAADFRKRYPHLAPPRAAAKGGAQ